MTLGRVRDNITWWSFAVRDNGAIGYLRHFRGYERFRRDTMRRLDGMTQDQAISELEDMLAVKVPR